MAAPTFATEAITGTLATEKTAEQDVDVAVAIMEGTSAALVERELPIVQSKRRIEIDAMSRENGWTQADFIGTQDALLRATPNECTVEDEGLHTLLCGMKKDVVRKRRHVQEQLELYNEISTDVSSVAQRLSNLKRRSTEHFQKVCTGVSVWNQSECSADSLAAEVERIKVKFISKSEKLKEDLDQLHDQSLHDLVLQVDGTEQAFKAYSKNHRKQSEKEAELLKELRRKQAAKTSLKAETNKLDRSSKALEAQLTEMEGEQDRIKGELAELAKTNKAELRVVLTNITKKKIALTADIEDINNNDSSMDELEHVMDAHADKAFAESARLEFDAESKPTRRDHIILAATEEACSGPHAQFLKYGLKHFASKRHASNPNAEEDVVSLIKASSDGASTSVDRGSMSMALDHIVEKGTPAVESISFADIFKRAFEQVEKHTGEHASANTIIIFITGTRPQDVDDLQHASACAGQIHQLVSDTRGSCHGVGVILGEGATSSDVGGLCLGLNGGQTKEHTTFIFQKPTMMWRSFEQIATNFGARSHMMFRDVASVTQKYAQYAKVHKHHLSVKRQKLLERKEKELVHLDTAGENSKKRLNEMKHAMTEFLESEGASHAKLAESLSEELEQAKNKSLEMAKEITILEDELSPLESELHGLQQSATTEQDLHIFTAARQKLLKLNTFDQDAFKAAGNASLDTWETIEESLNLRNHAISVFLTEMSSHLEALSSSSISKLDPQTAVQRVLAKYCEEGVIQEVKPSIASKNWIEIVKHHKPETEEFSDKDVELFARNMPMKEFLVPGVTLEKLKEKLLASLADVKEFSGHRKAMASSTRKKDLFKKKVQRLEEDLEELDENDRLDEDAKREISDDLKDKLAEARGAQRDAESELKEAKDEMTAEIQDNFHRLFDMIKDVLSGVETMHTGVILAAGAEDHVHKLMDLDSTFQMCGGPVVHNQLPGKKPPVKALAAGGDSTAKALGPGEMRSLATGSAVQKGG